MKILLNVNVTPNIIRSLENKTQNTFGGWVDLNIEIFRSLGYEIGVIYPNEKKEAEFIIKDNIKFFPLRQKRRLNLLLSFYDSDINNIINIFNPDLVFLEGTELTNTYRIARALKTGYLLSMQGNLESVYKTYNGGLTLSSLFNTAGFIGILTWLGLSYVKYLVIWPKIKYEKFVLYNASAYIGRTEWDYELVPKSKKNLYYKIERPLRLPFYSDSWVFENCKKYRIFFGNGKISYKGLHDVINAVKILKEKYSDIEVIVAAGYDNSKWPFNLIKYNYYIKYIIKKYSLEENVKLVGEINDNDIKKLMLSSNVFVLSSYIENSPNTLAEAMMLGLPSVVTSVGGVSSMTKDNISSCFYSPGDIDALVFLIKRIFEDVAFAKELSSNSKGIAKRAHNIDIIAKKFAASTIDFLKLNSQHKV
jgi:glycosyltransferase involved in cell wall biosynthesis